MLVCGFRPHKSDLTEADHLAKIRCVRNYELMLVVRRETEWSDTECSVERHSASASLLTKSMICRCQVADGGDSDPEGNSVMARVGAV